MVVLEGFIEKLYSLGALSYDIVHGHSERLVNTSKSSDLKFIDINFISLRQCVCECRSL